MLTKLKPSINEPNRTTVRANLGYSIALLIPKTLLQNLLRNSRLVSSELTIKAMPITAGKVQMAISMIRIAKPIFKSAIEIDAMNVNEEVYTITNSKILQLLSIYYFILIFDLLKNHLFR